MTKTEFSRAIALMNQMRDDESLELLSFMQGDMALFDGFGLKHFEPVTCTIKQLAQLIAYQCIQFSGGLCQSALDEIWQARRKLLVVGDGSDEVEADRLYRSKLRSEIDRLASVA